MTFRVVDNFGDPIDPTDMDYLALTVAGPTDDYVARVTDVIARSSDEEFSVELEEVEDEDGVYRYTFTYALPQAATGTYAIAIEGYNDERIIRGEDPYRIPGRNQIVYVAMDGGEPTPRRQVIDQTLCNNCHGDLAFHGDIRENTDYCVMCHNPNATDEARRPEEASPPTSVDFRVLIHRIHRGEDSSQAWEVYGFGGEPHDYSHVAFPGDLATCETCHLPNTYDMRSAAASQPATITQAGEVIDIIPPIQSVCNACHDSTAAGAHSELQTTSSNIEACEVCHGPGREFDVANAHR